jgi:Ser/Thr protein kinase RdoA (MazF antagonist)
LSLTVEAVDGEPLGAKFPLTLAGGEVGELVRLVEALAPYRPRRRWFRRFDIERRLRCHVGEGLITASDAQAVASLATRDRVRCRFAHGDVTARNVLRDSTRRLVLIDWEWAGLYPNGYELAFLWFSLVDVAGGREVVEKAVRPGDHAGFLVSAVLIQLLHLHLWLRSPPNQFVPKHEDILHALLRTIPSGSSSLPR